MSRLIEQLREAVLALDVCEPPPALIGGLALAAHGVVRATSDASRPQRGGYAEFVALLDLVEALCPRWPSRPVTADGGRFLL